MTKEQMKEQLRKHTVKVTFTKVNGDERVMPCTLIPEMLPQALNEGKPTREENPNTIAVWDMALQAWRAFRVDSVKEFVVSA